MKIVILQYTTRHHQFHQHVYLKDGTLVNQFSVPVVQLSPELKKQHHLE